MKTTLDISGGKEILVLPALAILVYGVRLPGTTLAARVTGGLSWNDAATVGHWMCARGAIGFAIFEICIPSGLREPRGFSILAFVVLVNTIVSAWDVLLQQKWTGNYEVRRELVLAGDP